MKRFSTLLMPIDFNINCVVQQGEPMLFLLDIGSPIQEIAQKLKILHLYRIMGSIHFSHLAPPNQSSRSS